MESVRIRLCGRCWCGASHDEPTHHEFCISKIPGPYAELAPYWWQGWNEFVQGKPSRVHEGRHEPRASFKMGYLMAQVLQGRGEKPALHAALHPSHEPASGKTPPD